MSTPVSQSAPVPAQQAALVERADIHKSCKAVEGLLGIFNEYCEAVGAVGALQKRLAKALREAAGVKGTGEIAGALLLLCVAICRVLLTGYLCACSECDEHERDSVRGTGGGRRQVWEGG